MTIAAGNETKKTPAEEQFARAFTRDPSPVAEMMAEIALERKLAARRIQALTKWAMAVLDGRDLSPTERADNPHDYPH